MSKNIILTECNLNITKCCIGNEVYYPQTVTDQVILSDGTTLTEWMESLKSSVGSQTAVSTNYNSGTPIASIGGSTIYVPIGSTSQAGLLRPDDNYFDVINGVVTPKMAYKPAYTDTIKIGSLTGDDGTVLTDLTMPRYTLSSTIGSDSAVLRLLCGGDLVSTATIPLTTSTVTTPTPTLSFNENTSTLYITASDGSYQTSVSIPTSTATTDTGNYTLSYDNTSMLSLLKDGTAVSYVKLNDYNTTYTFSVDGNVLTITDSTGATQTVTLPTSTSGGDGSGVTYTAGSNISISSSNVISAVDTKYTAGTNVSISNTNVISSVDTNTTYGLSYDSTTHNLAFTSSDSDSPTTIDLSGLITTDTNSEYRLRIADTTIYLDEYADGYSASATPTTVSTISIPTTTASGETITDNNTTYTLSYNSTTNQLTFTPSDTNISPTVIDLSALAVNTTYTGGTNVSISSDNVISAVDTTYTAGTNVDITSNVISATDTKYTAGNNVQISTDNVISATNTTYTAGTNVDITNGVISAVNTEYVGGTNVDITYDTVTGNNVISATDTTYSVFTNAIDGLVPHPGTLTSTLYLDSTGNWSTPSTGSSTGSIPINKFSIDWTNADDPNSSGATNTGWVGYTDNGGQDGNFLLVGGDHITLSNTPTTYTMSGIQYGQLTINADIPTLTAGTSNVIISSEDSNGNISISVTEPDVYDGKLVLQYRDNEGNTTDFFGSSANNKKDVTSIIAAGDNITLTQTTEDNNNVLTISANVDTSSINIPTVNDAMVHFQGNGTAVGYFSANADTEKTFNIKSGDGVTVSTASTTTTGTITISSNITVGDGLSTSTDSNGQITITNTRSANGLVEYLVTGSNVVSGTADAIWDDISNNVFTPTNSANDFHITYMMENYNGVSEDDRAADYPTHKCVFDGQAMTVSFVQYLQDHNLTSGRMIFECGMSNSRALSESSASGGTNAPAVSFFHGVSGDTDSTYSTISGHAYRVPDGVTFGSDNETFGNYTTTFINWGYYVDGDNVSNYPAELCANDFSLDWQSDVWQVCIFDVYINSENKVYIVCNHKTYGTYSNKLASKTV